MDEMVAGATEQPLALSIGVSSFESEHLDRLAEVGDVVPAVNQIELQPFLFPVIAEIAGRHNVNAARVVFAWNLQLGSVVPAQRRGDGCDRGAGPR